MAATQKSLKSPRKFQKSVQIITFVVLLCFVLGFFIAGGLSFRSGINARNPSSAPTQEATSTPLPQVDSVKQAKEAVRLNPKDPFALRNLARAELQQGQAKEAETAAQGALKLFPNDVLNFELLGQIQVRQGRMKEAVDYFKKAVAARHNDPILLFELAQSFSLNGKDLEAKEYYEKIISLNPNSMVGVRSRIALMTSAMARNELSEAKKQAVALYDLAPGDPQILVRLGEIAEKQRHFGEAIADYEKASKLQPQDKALASHLAELKRKFQKEKMGTVPKERID